MLLAVARPQRIRRFTGYDPPSHSPLQTCLPDILAALDSHLDEPDIQTKGLVLLGVLIQVGGGGGMLR